LAAAIKLSPTEYDLILQNDANTSGYIQWFFFKVTPAVSGTLKLNLLNHIKSNSLYNYGMRVLVGSEVDGESGGYEWRRGCTEIIYKQNNFRRENLYGLPPRYYYSLSFRTDYLEQ
jgi:cytosolic carboxypeptidase protein 2/3